ncbi:MAG: type VII toxin-antitoxin system HepT family RNase toxin [Thermoleophilia bacterium]
MSLDSERIAAFVSDIRQSRTRLVAIAALDEQEFLADADSQDIARSRLLTAIQAALAICYHVCAKEFDHVPDDYAGCFNKLGETGTLSAELATRLARMARFRNRLVHVYWNTDYRQVHRILRENLDDLEDFVRAVEKLL